MVATRPLNWGGFASWSIHEGVRSLAPRLSARQQHLDEMVQPFEQVNT